MQNLIVSSKIALESLSYEYTENKVTALLQGLSLERLSRYEKLVPSDRTKQLQLYIWNTALSESLYTPIQGLEIVARNYFNNALVECYGEKWYSSPKIQFIHPQLHSISQAKENIQKDGKSLAQNNLVSVYLLDSGQDF